MKRKKIKRVLELRATSIDLKGLEEQRAAVQEEMDQLVNKIEEEKRAFNDEEEKKFKELESEKKRIDTSIQALEAKRAADEKSEENNNNSDPKKDDKTKLEERAFENYIRGIVSEERADNNLTFTDNGAVIPSSIAQKIITKVHEISPIYQLATRYNVGGTLSIPYYDEDTSNIQMAYATEFTDLESTSGKFKNIELKGFLAGALSKISNSLINNSQFDIVSFIINKMAQSIALWIEKELINGTDDKIQGLRGVTREIESASSLAITADEAIDLQEKIPDEYQLNAIWIMSKNTRTALRKLKDGNGQYILNKDATARWGYTLFGKDVYTSENMSDISAGKTAIYYGDMSGLAVKLSEEVNIQILREKFATQHSTGVIAWCELDSKVENAQKIARLKIKA